MERHEEEYMKKMNDFGYLLLVVLYRTISLLFFPVIFFWAVFADFDYKSN